MPSATSAPTGAAAPTGAVAAAASREPVRGTVGATGRRRLLVLAGVVLVALSLRPAVTAVSPLLQDVRADLGMTATAAGLLGTAPTVAFAVFGALTPALVRRLGLERVAWAAMLLTTAGQLLRAVAPSTETFLLFSLVALGGMGAGNVVLPPLVRRYFPARVGLVTGMYVLLLAAGTAVPPLIAVPVADAAGWRASAASWALLSLAAAVPWLAAGTAGRPSRPSRGAQRRLAGPGLARSPVAWGLAGLFGMTSLNTYAMLGWLPTLLTEAGLSRAAAGAMLALYAGVGIPLSVAVPWAATRMRNPFPLLVLCLGCYAVGYVGLVWAPATATAVWVVASGLAPAAFPLALTLVNLRSRTTEGSTALSGFGQGIGYTVAGAGPLLMGWLREQSGGWGASFTFLGATLLVQVVAGYVVCRPRMVEDEVAARQEGSAAATTLET